VLPASHHRAFYLHRIRAGFAAILTQVLQLFAAIGVS
jgi:hypothetical protein